ncbi:unnamed protein product [Lymnaea stagnalis]|uniref:MD-2-related lipid-recognition domain-containing protein n=1 Tax=Lymnaea stagnalis TaxID=6523 RepID=A0AAV2HPB9_LYMST
MKFAVVTLATILVATLSTTGECKVRYNEIEAQRMLFDLLMSKPDKSTLSKVPGLKTYKYVNCGNPSTDLANLLQLVIGPDPLTFPGPLNVQFSVNIKTLVDAPIKGQLLLAKKVGDSWLKIPCVGIIGSCTYDDVCALLALISECPPQFVTAGVPCQCPFQKGSYTLPTAEFDVEIPLFPAGDYHAVANLTRNADSISCVEIFATFA